MYEAEALIRSASRIRDDIWCSEPGKSAILGRVWFKTYEGEQALCAFMLGMNETTTEAASLLVMRVFQLQCEIAARKAGWCPELPPGPPHPGADELYA
jgi:hypothetical protein